MGIIWTIVARDLRARLKDRSALLLGVVAPLALIIIFSLTISGTEETTQDVGFVGADTTAQAQALTQAFTSGAFPALESDGTLAVKEFTDATALRAAIRSEEVAAGLMVDSSQVVVLRGPNSTIASAILTAVADSVTESVADTGRVIAAEHMLGSTPSAPAAVASELSRTPPSVTVGEAHSVGGLTQKTMMAAGMATFFLFFTVGFGVQSLLEERRVGTLKRLLVAPIRRWQIISAKLAVSFVLGVAAMAVLLICSQVLLGADWGNPAGVALLVLAGVLAATSTITLVVGLAKTTEQAAVGTAMVAMVLGVLGGSFFPVNRAGPLMQAINHATPHYWFSEGLTRLSMGGHVQSVALPVLVLLAMALLCGIPGLILANRTVRP